MKGFTGLPEKWWGHLI